MAFMNESWMSYNFSKNTASFVTRFTMLLDKSARLNMLTPTYPWKMYN
jgi:hypothetical protein